ncbi:MAG: hypothetical protein CMJ18_10415 [Phycisphaeraceae bacterium]|nr:hypothetical protein [Phycisphaeraceae bacterium]
MLTVVVVLLAAMVTDATERFIELTRVFEAWELDEILLAVGAALAAGLIVSIVQIEILARRIRRMESGKAKARDGAALHPDPVMKCAHCLKFKLDDQTWVLDREFISRRYDLSVVAGVCPTCDAASRPR